MSNKLELTWVGKEERPRLEPRILLSDPTLSHYSSRPKTEGDIFDNLLIEGDNLLALKALEHEFGGRVQCVYIDPPFNTQQAFEQYDDGVEHSEWLSMLRDRLEVLHRLLAREGSLWLHLDDSEMHRARCVLDEVFGAANFIGTVVWEKSDSPRMDAEFFSSRHDYIIVYAKEKDSTKFNRLPMEGGLPEHYNKVDENGRPYYTKPLRAMGGQGDSRASRPKLYFAMEAPDGTKVFPKRQDGTDGAWRWSPEKVAAEAERIEWVRGRNGWTPYFRIYGNEESTRPPETLWPHGEVGSNRTSKAEIKALLPDTAPFATPKPERLLARILTVATDPGDIVLDSFGGSGTTGAVAHKLRRKWIMVELGEHARTHIVPRLKKVVDGEDPNGATEQASWMGGGGFRFYRLAPSLLERDEYGNWVISPQYNAAMLAEALCKFEGFRYDPSPTVYWQQGKAADNSYIYVTTQTLTAEQLKHLNDEVGPKRSLLVCCGSFSAKSVDAFPRLTIKKIPKAVLHRCEWGRDDYSLAIKELPVAEKAETKPVAKANASGKKAERKKAVSLLNFGDE